VTRHGRPRVLVCGDVVNDILVEPLARLTHGDDNPAAIQARPGGSAANQAAWMAHLGLDVVFAGRAGAGDVEFHRRELSRFGVLPMLAADRSAATGSIVVLVGPDGDRTMITDRGANLRLTPADVPAGLFDGVALLHLTGYSFFEPGPRGVALSLVAEARRRGAPFTIDPGSAAFLDVLEPGAFLKWTEGAAVCFPNRDEAAVLTGSGTTADPAAMAARLAGHYGAVVVKLGAEGAVLASGDAPPVSITARPAEVRDTTGAGDAFCAGFLATWLATGDMAAAAASGAEAAAVAVSRLGGRPQPADRP
jgi:sugar/nucleoside kinase (ribokinase family)